MHTCEHPSAETIYASLKPQIPDLSLGTVYRNLALLVEMGDVLKVGPDREGKERYDGHTHPHAHFFCEECGRIEDISEVFDTHPIEETLHIRIHEANITLKGVCRDCLQKEKEN